MTATELIAAVKSVIVNERAGVIYLHDDPRGPAIAAIVAAGTPEYDAMARGFEGFVPMPNHSHLEPGEDLGCGREGCLLTHPHRHMPEGILYI